MVVGWLNQSKWSKCNIEWLTLWVHCYRQICCFGGGSQNSSKAQAVHFRLSYTNRFGACSCTLHKNVLCKYYIYSVYIYIFITIEEIHLYGMSPIVRASFDCLPNPVCNEPTQCPLSRGVAFASPPFVRSCSWPQLHPTMSMHSHKLKETRYSIKVGKILLKWWWIAPFLSFFELLCIYIYIS